MKFSSQKYGKEDQGDKKRGIMLTQQRAEMLFSQFLFDKHLNN